MWGSANMETTSKDVGKPQAHNSLRHAIYNTKLEQRQRCEVAT
jgi:hypothetical protein